MFVACLADFFNLKLWGRGQPISYADARDGVDDLVAASLEALSNEGLKATELTIRLYGGWHDRETSAATSARDIVSKVIQHYPRRVGARIRLQIAEALFAAPHIQLIDTLRRVPYSNVVAAPIASTQCFRRDSCTIGVLADWLRGRCPEKECAVQTREIVQVKQQKLIDTLLTVDALSLAYGGEVDALIVASDDDDMVPALLGTSRLGMQVINLRRRDERSAGCYDALLELSGVKFTYW